MSEHEECMGDGFGSPGTTISWRMFAALESGAILLGGLALLAQAVRPRPADPRLVRQALPPTTDRSLHILISEDKSECGREIVRQLRQYGCSVSTLASGETERADAIVIVGSEQCSEGLEGLGHVVSEDVYTNMRWLETAPERVRAGGRLVWAGGSRAAGGAFVAPAAAFDDVLRAQLHRIADEAQCEAVWLDRDEIGCPATLALRVLGILLPQAVPVQQLQSHRESFPLFDFRGATTRLSLVLWRWLKNIT